MDRRGLHFSRDNGDDELALLDCVLDLLGADR